MLLDPRLVDRIRPLVAPSQVVDPRLAALLEIAYELHDREGTLDTVSVAAKAREKYGKTGRGLDEVFLSDLLDHATTSEKVLGLHARHVSGLARKRAVRAKCSEIAHLCDTNESFEAIQLALADAQLSAFPADRQAVFGAAEPIYEALEGLESGKAGAFFPSHLYRLNSLINGFYRKELTLIAARPSAGKTALMLNLLRTFSLAGTDTLVVSLEMSKDALAQRLFAAETGINGHRIRSNTLNQAELESCIEAGQRISRWPFRITDSGGLNVFDIRALVREEKSRNPNLAIVMIDYLQFIGESGQHENRNSEVTLISRSLKALAKELDVSMIVLSQLKRPQQGTEFRPPMLSDLRDSGSLEQDADLVLFIHRIEHLSIERARKEGLVGKARIIVGKQRNGPIGDTTVMYEAPCMRFTDVDHLDAHEDPSGVLDNTSR